MQSYLLNNKSKKTTNKHFQIISKTSRWGLKGKLPSIHFIIPLQPTNQWQTCLFTFQKLLLLLPSYYSCDHLPIITIVQLFAITKLYEEKIKVKNQAKIYNLLYQTIHNNSLVPKNQGKTKQRYKKKISQPSMKNNMNAFIPLNNTTIYKL